MGSSFRVLAMAPGQLLRSKSRWFRCERNRAPARWDANETVAVVADQFWMHQHLVDRRIGLTSLQLLAADGHPVELMMVMPQLPALEGFVAAAES